MNKLSVQQSPLFNALFRKAGFNFALGSLDVEVLEDGGMGSHRLSLGKSDSVFGELACEIKFKDRDGIEVLASLLLDQYGNPFEVDIFKGDFSQLECWPSEDELNDGN